MIDTKSKLDKELIKSNRAGRNDTPNNARLQDADNIFTSGIRYCSAPNVRTKVPPFLIGKASSKSGTTFIFYNNPCFSFLADLIQKCKLSDPKFDDCLLNSANNFVSTVFRGNKKYDIPPVDISSNLSSIYQFGENFTLTFINLTTNIYDNLEVKNIRFDFDKKLLVFGLISDLSMYSGKYDANGVILGKLAHQSGCVNMTFDYMEINVIVPLDFKMKNDKKYVEAVSCMLFSSFKNFQFKPYDQMIVGEPMTVEQDKVFKSYIARLPGQLQKDNEKHDKDIVYVLNKLFNSMPFENLFIP
ncbi:hypothetical protein CBL_08268 [Carabus blaptoides fortunei]